MPVFERPHLKVDQPRSAFADGNQRWCAPLPFALFAYMCFLSDLDQDEQGP